MSELTEQQKAEQAKLKVVAAEIKAVLQKHDVAGIVNLQGVNMAEYVMEVTPSWACLTWEMDSEGHPGLRFKAALKTGDAAEKERGRATTGMVMGFLDVLAFQFQMLDKLRELLAKHMAIEHTSQHIPGA